MALREQFVPDLGNVFINVAEFGTVREFRINDGQGGYKIFNAKVVWDSDAVKMNPVVTIHGVFMGDVRCYIRHQDLPRAPVAGELIYSPANQPWEVLDCMDAESLYELSLAAARSQPSMYGRN